MPASNRQADFVWYRLNAATTIPDVVTTVIPADFANERGAFVGASSPVGTGYELNIPSSLDGRIAMAGAAVRSNTFWAVNSTIRVDISGPGFTVPTSHEQTKVANFTNASVVSAPFVCSGQNLDFNVRVPGNGGAANVSRDGTTYWVAAFPDDWSNDFLITKMSGSNYTTALATESPIPFDTVDIDRTGGADLVNDRINLTVGNVYLVTAEVLVDGTESFGAGSVLTMSIRSNLSPFRMVEKRFTGNDMASSTNPLCYTMTTLLFAYGGTPNVSLEVIVGSGINLIRHNLSVLDLGKESI